MNTGHSYDETYRGEASQVGTAQGPASPIHEASGDQGEDSLWFASAVSDATPHPPTNTIYAVHLSMMYDAQQKQVVCSTQVVAFPSRQEDFVPVIDSTARSFAKRTFNEVRNKRTFKRDYKDLKTAMKRMSQGKRASWNPAKFDDDVLRPLTAVLAINLANELNTYSRRSKFWPEVKEASAEMGVNYVAYEDWWNVDFAPTSNYHFG